MTNYEDIAHVEEYADPRCPYRILTEAEEPGEVPVRHSPETLKRLADFMKGMASFAAAHPEAWESLRIKLDRPELSYREIGELLGIGRSTVYDHLQAAIEAVPELEGVLDVKINQSTRRRNE